MSWKAEIEKVDNGFTVKYSDYAEDLETEIMRTNVFQAGDDMMDAEDHADKECLAQAFHFLAEHFGLGYEKYSKSNIKITCDLKGHKVEDEDEENQ